ncbi:hypothetical protein [uncultured Enterococcus sp.]|uniref:hypothetical protein n=1 Tax=uncultured Enterococcus sp. TaxID=167972 RepID=UPI002AA7CBAE|nr:hypothetical protein [uncultured Enterococcus sp.]
MKTALFTDLDGTILFSKRTLPETLSEENCFKAESYGNGGYGLMENDLLVFFEEWQKDNYLIPITTRSTEQFERLNEVWKRLPVPFALTSNGGNLYRDGVLDEGWNKEVRIELTEELAHREAILAILKVILPEESVRKIKDIDGLYYCVLVTERGWAPEFIQEVNAAVAVYDWIGYFQHKKLYFLPKNLSKEQAMKRLTAQLNIDGPIKGLGDTEMDLELLLQSDAHLFFGEPDMPVEGLIQQGYSLGKIKKLLEI